MNLKISIRPIFFNLTSKGGVIICLSLLAILLSTKGSIYAQDKVWQSIKGKKIDLQQHARSGQNRAKRKMDQFKYGGTDNSYNQALYIGGRLHTNGWSGQVHYHFQKDNHSQKIVRFQFAEIRHEKEIRQQRQDTVYRSLASYRPYIFGKQYKVYTTQLGYGRQWTIFPSLIQGNISLNASLEAGLSMTLLKPVYLDLLRYDALNQAYASSESYNTSNQELFLSRNRLLGADKWSKGLNELRCIPGIYISPSVIFSSDKPSSFVQQFQIGAQLAYYTKAIPLLLQQKNTFWQASFFVGFSLGKRW